MNPITLYVVSDVVDFRSLAQRLAGGDLEASLNANIAYGLGGLLVAVVQVGLVVWLARFLYRREVFLRL